MKTVAILQARMGATRLPGKVLADIEGRTLIERVIERSRAARGVDEVVVATTTHADDDALEGFLMDRGLAPVFRGSMEDVLDRYYQAASRHAADVIVRVTADDPLKDPGIIELALRQMAGSPELDYCSNTLQPTYPEGLDIEVFRRRALDKAWSEARLPSEREHVTPYIWNHPDCFRLLNFRYARDLSSWRWTVDKPNDLEFMRAVFARFRDTPLVGYEEIIRWLEENPRIREINSGTIRNEGYLRSLESEK